MLEVRKSIDSKLYVANTDNDFLLLDCSNNKIYSLNNFDIDSIDIDNLIIEFKADYNVNRLFIEEIDGIYYEILYCSSDTDMALIRKCLYYPDLKSYSVNHIKAFIEYMEDYGYCIEGIEYTYFYPNVSDEKDYGYLIYNEFVKNCLRNCSIDIEGCIDFEQLGTDTTANENGEFTEYGYIIFE